METGAIASAFLGITCAACKGAKRRHVAFCTLCYRQLPPALRKSLWKRFGQGFEEAYQASISWFREHPFQGEHRAKQADLF